MTKANFKKAMKEAMVKYGADVDFAMKLALSNYPEHFDVITAASLEITQEEMGIKA